jgi:hypothetical protein
MIKAGDKRLFGLIQQRATTLTLTTALLTPLTSILLEAGNASGATSVNALGAMSDKQREVESKTAGLRPSEKYWDQSARRVPVRLTRLSRGRKLATAGDTLYMLDAQNRVVWTWSTQGPPLTDLPIVDSQATIYVIGFDLIWAALDAATGKEKWRGTANGRAVYTQLRLYKDDLYLVVTDMEGYRVNLSDRTIQDNLTLCRGNDILWETSIPAGTRIKVQNGRVFALVRRKNRMVRREIVIPHKLGAPIGKVSVQAGSK